MGREKFARMQIRSVLLTPNFRYMREVLVLYTKNSFKARAEDFSRKSGYLKDWLHSKFLVFNAGFTPCIMFLKYSYITMISKSTKCKFIRISLTSKTLFSLVELRLKFYSISMIFPILLLQKVTSFKFPTNRFKFGFKFWKSWNDKIHVWKFTKLIMKILQIFRCKTSKLDKFKDNDCNNYCKIYKITFQILDKF